MGHVNGRILFRLTPTSLVVANSGTAFTLHGLIAVIYGWTSTKKEEPHSWPEEDRPFRSEEDAKTIITERREAKKSHLENRYELNSQSSQQFQTVQSYAGRVLVELLQNAVDAGQEKPIGYKGVGFRSVLNITDSPEIHSGHLHACWSPDIARNTIGEAAANLPVLAFPQWCPDRSGVEEGYTTTVVLPLSPEKHRQIREEWNRFVSDPSLVVFIEGVNEVIWDAGKNPTVWRRTAPGDEVEIEQTIGDEEPETLRWRVHRFGEAAVAVPVDAAGELRVSPTSAAEGLRCFFPTEDTNPFGNVLIHARFDLATDRKHIDTDSSKARERIGNLVKDIAVAMANAAAERPHIGETIDVLQSTLSGDTTTEGIQSRLREAVRSEMLDLPIPALGKNLLSSFRSCPRPNQLPGSFGNGEKRIELWENFKGCVDRHGPGRLDDLGLLPLSTESPTREVTLLWLNPDAALTKGDLQKLLWAKAVGEVTPCDSSSLFESPGDEACDVPPIPRNIALHFLDPDLQRDVAEQLENAAAAFLKDTLGVRKFGLAEVIGGPVLEALKKGDQPEGTVEFLFALWSGVGKQEQDHFDWTVPWRARLIRECNVRCRNGEVRPVLEVYAGSEWTSSEFLERCYGSRGDRAFLHLPPDELEVREPWAKFYRWLGVGWGPKVLPLVLETTDQVTRRGLLWKDGRFPMVDAEPPDWRGYSFASG